MKVFDLLAIFVISAAIFSGQPGCNKDKHAYDYQTNTPKGTAEEGSFVPTDKPLQQSNNEIKNEQNTAETTEQ